MPDDPATVTSGRWPLLDGTAPFESLAALQAAHHRLRRSLQDTSDAAAKSDPAEAIRSFIARTQNTGTVLVERPERKAAQSLIDYWSAELASRPGAPASDFVPKVLAPIDGHATTTTTTTLDPTGQATPAREARSREVIRIAATARQYSESKLPGYLLGGKAIEDAARFSDIDPDIAKLVKASKAFQRQKFWRMLSYVLVIIAAIGACAGAFRYFMPQWRDWVARAIRGPLTAQQLNDNLDTLSALQSWSPPTIVLDLSGSSIYDVKKDGRNFTLYYPNFAKASFKNAQLVGATLPNGFFGDSDVVNSDFSCSHMPFAQFSRANVSSTHFEGAELYRAKFDEAMLCNVKFDGADLRLASFRSARFGPVQNLYKAFHRTGWWLATGWRDDQIKTLRSVVPLGPAGDNERKLLKETPAFHNDQDRNYAALHNTNINSIEHAQAFNSIAWTLATWGIDLGDEPLTVDSDQHCLKNTEPKTATEAVNLAICTAESLGPMSGKDKKTVAGFFDTKAYILMQQGKMIEAIQLFEGQTYIVKRESGSLFRYAVARFAAGKDQDTAVKDMRLAATRDNYVPSHELQTLQNYIKGKIETDLNEIIDRRSPKLEADDCPEPSIKSQIEKCTQSSTQ